MAVTFEVKADPVRSDPSRKKKKSGKKVAPH
jgi:hypothetical protein